MSVFLLVEIVAILLVLHQVAIPLFQGLPLFPFFREKKLEDELGEVKQQLKEKELGNKIKEVKTELKGKK